MKWNRWVRRTHRKLSIVFTVAVLANIALNVLPLGSEEIALWVGMITLLPLALLLLTGLYLFVLPYTGGRDLETGTDS